jgi:hypothetical protein
MARVFISYRRDDGEGFAGRLYDRLSARFGQDNVFMDVDAIPIGDEFPATIQRQLDQCDAMVVVIGPRWLGRTEKQQPRIFMTSDWVRREVAMGLKKNRLVVPVLVGGASMPMASELPEDLLGLLERQSWEIRPQAFQQRVNEMTGLLEQALKEGAERRKQEELAKRKQAEIDRATQYAATHFALKPFQYPLWVQFFCAAIFLAAIMSVVTFPTYLPAAVALKHASDASERGDLGSAVRFYQTVLTADSSSREAKLGLAMVLFKQGPLHDREALNLLGGLRIYKTEWKELTKVMPAKYQSQFESVK